jgi:hypothetical protein
MVFFKLGLLTCAFYAVLTIALEVVLKAMIRFSGGLSLFVYGKHPALTVGGVLGVIFGIVWLISYSAAWWIMYLDLKSKLWFLAN